MYIIETQKVLDLKINLMASYVIVPENGFYDPKHNLAILDLGHFQVKTCHCQCTWFFIILHHTWHGSFNKLGFSEVIQITYIRQNNKQKDWKKCEFLVSWELFPQWVILVFKSRLREEEKNPANCQSLVFKVGKKRAFQAWSLIISHD